MTNEASAFSIAILSLTFVSWNRNGELILNLSFIFVIIGSVTKPANLVRLVEDWH